MSTFIFQKAWACSPILSQGDSSPYMSTERSAVGSTQPEKVSRRWHDGRVEYQPVGRISVSNGSAQFASFEACL